MRIAFIACNKNRLRYGSDPAFIYRCENLAYSLRELGFDVWIGHINDFPWWQKWSATIFHRPKIGWRSRFLNTLLARQGTLQIADFDDLVFDPELARFSPGVLNNLMSSDDIRAQFLQHRRAAARFDVITVSTPPLATHAMSVPGCSSRVVVVPNALHWSWMKTQPLPAPNADPLLSYMPGTRSHDRDFATVSAGLSKIMQRHSRAHLAVTGPLRFSLPTVADRVQQRAKLPFEHYHEAFKSVHINLAPLEPTPFTECKSAIKVMEAAWWDIPTVCSALPDALRFADTGAVMVNSPAAFEEATDALLIEGWQERGLRERVRPIADVRKVARDWCINVLKRTEI